MRIIFAFSLFILFSLIWCFHGFLYTGVFPIIGLVYYLIEKFELFHQSQTTNEKSLTQFIIDKFKDDKFIYSVNIILWGLILIMISIQIFYNEEKESSVESIKTLSGIIWNENNEPIDSVIVFLPEFNKYDTTNSFGKFEFHVQSDSEITINIIAKKEGFRTFDSDGTLGSTSYSIILKKIK